MILVGSSSAKRSQHRHQESLSLSQLIVINSVDRARKDEASSSKRILSTRETPLPMYVGIFLYNETRSKKIINTLFSLGLSISYTRVLSLSSNIARAVEERFEEDGVVCPVQLRQSLFTTAAVDNLDYNPTSTSSKKAFHGTGISIFQYHLGVNHLFPLATTMFL